MDKKERLKNEIKEADAPAIARNLARELYKLGEEKYALDVIIEQLNRYKDPDYHPRSKAEICPNAISDLGLLGDMRAIPPLLDVLSEFPSRAAQALYRIGGEDLELQLHNFSKIDDARGLGAVLALGYMRIPEALQKIIDIVKNYDLYMNRLFSMPGTSDPYLLWDFLNVLGNYEDIQANETYLMHVDNSYLTHCVSVHATLLGVSERIEYTDINNRQRYCFSCAIFIEQGWEKYILDEYIQMEKTYHTCKPGSLRKSFWDKYHAANKEIVTMIINDIQEKLKAYNN